MVSVGVIPAYVLQMPGWMACHCVHPAHAQLKTEDETKKGNK